MLLILELMLFVKQKYTLFSKNWDQNIQFLSTVNSTKLWWFKYFVVNQYKHAKIEKNCHVDLKIVFNNDKFYCSTSFLINQRGIHSS